MKKFFLNLKKRGGRTGIIFTSIILIINSTLFPKTYKKIYFKYENSKIVYIGEKNVRIENFRYSRNGDWEIYFSEKNIKFFSVKIPDPLRETFDLDTPYTPFLSKEKKKEKTIFTAIIPPSLKFDKISFYKLHIVNNDTPYPAFKNKYFHPTIKKLIDRIIVKKRKPLSNRLKEIDNIKILAHKKFIDNGNERRRIDVVFIPIQYSEGELGAFHKTINSILYNVCWGGWTDRRTFFDASPIKEFKRLFNFHYLDVINFPQDWQQEIACMGDTCKDWLDDLVKKYIPIAPDVYVFVVKDYPWSSMSSYWSIIIRKDSCGNVLLRAFSRSIIGGGLYNEFDSSDNCSDKEAKEIISAKNVTVFTDKELIPWKHWISDSTPLPTPNTLLYKNTVGAFEGAYDYKCYYYRPQEKCVLHGDLWDFCKVCREYFTLTLLDNWFNPYVSATSNVPPAGEVVQPEDTPFVNFSVEIDEVLFSMLDSPNIVWLLDDKPIEGSDGKRSISLNTKLLKAGKHTVKAAIIGEVKSTTGFIRKFHDNHFYYTFPEFEIGKGKFSRGR